MIALKFWLLILPVLVYQDATATFENEFEGNVTCDGLKSCVKCDKKDADVGFRCIKCKRLIVLKSRECVDTCPVGYREEWSSLADYMGRICKEETVIAGISLSGRKLAVVLGSLIGLAICILIILLAIVYLKYRKKRMLQDKARQSPSLSHLTGTHRSQDSEDSERPEFLKQLRYLKTDAPIFLAMLNETRRQVRELRRPSRQNSAMQAYRPVLKDLSRILILLNRGEDRIGPPPADWETLLAWGERVLRRYKKQNSHQVSQLLGFTQLPIDGYESPSLGHSPYPTQLTTFPNNYGSSNHLTSASSSSSNNHLQQLAISAFDEAYGTRNRKADDDDDDMMELRTDDAIRYARRSPLLDSGVDVSSPRSMTHEFQRETETKRSNIVSEWNTGYHRPSSYQTSMMDDDDFYTLGFRPQDEITTEL